MLPSKRFGSKSEAMCYFSAMLQRYKDGEGINAFDDLLLFELLQRHPQAHEKMGVGIKRFYRDRSPTHPSSCFHLERYDGTTTDFSYRLCLSSAAPSRMCALGGRPV